MTCAFAVRGALKKFPGVESVEVSLNQGLATVKLKPGNILRPDELWDAVRKNGFTPKETKVVVRGEVQAGRFKVSGTQQLFDLLPPGLPAGKPLTVQGSLTPLKDLKVAVPLVVRSVQNR